MIPVHQVGCAPWDAVCMGLVVDSGFVVSRAARTFDGFGCLMLSFV